MARFILHRIAAALLLIFGIATLTFFMLQVVPGDPVAMMMQEHASPEVIERVRHEMGLNDPLWLRYSRFLHRLLQGDFGYSYKLKRDAAELIGGAFPATLRLTGASLLVAWLIGIPAGAVAAMHRGDTWDTTMLCFSLLGVSMPVFWSSLLLQNFFGLRLGWLPLAADDSWTSYILPALTLGWGSSGAIARLTRTALLDILSSDYLRTARAKGLREHVAVMRHALPNAMLPVLTVMTMQVAHLLSGSVLTESIYGIPGVGRLSVHAIQNRDMPLLQAAVVFEAALVVAGNLLADISYILVDPRLKRQ